MQNDDNLCWFLREEQGCLYGVGFPIDFCGQRRRNWGWIGRGLGGGGETRRKPNPRRKQDQLPLFCCCCCSLVGCRSAHVRKVSVDSCETTFLDFSRLFSFPIIYLFSKFHLLTSSHALSLSLSPPRLTVSPRHSPLSLSPLSWLGITQISETWESQTEWCGVVLASGAYVSPSLLNPHCIRLRSIKNQSSFFIFQHLSVSFLFHFQLLDVNVK